MSTSANMATKITRKQTTKTKEKKFDMSGPWTPEKKAEFRKLMPKKLNKFGEWFFSEAGGKEYIVVNDWRAVLR